MRQRTIEIVPRGKPLRWRWYDVPQHVAPETSDALRFCAVEGDLELLDRRHRSTIEAVPFAVCRHPPAALVRGLKLTCPKAGRLSSDEQGDALHGVAAVAEAVPVRPVGLGAAG